MSLRNIAKNGGALIGGPGVNLINQLLLPPLFLHNYGVASFGDWLTLTATVTYLASLNFGLQTFTNNQVAIHYNRGEREEAYILQATTLVLILGIVISAAALISVVFFVPINVWLRIGTSRSIVSATIYLLGLQVLIRMPFGFFVGMFLGVGEAHRGLYWNVALGVLGTLGTAAMVFAHVSFIWIAAQQLLTVAFLWILVMIDVRLRAPDLFPQFRYARPRHFKQILKPSGYFGLLFTSNFLVFQLPVVLMQRILGPTSVVVFSLSRTIYSMSRQGLIVMSWAIGPEITELYGKHDWKRLFRLYELSERVIFALVPVFSIGTLLVTPILMTIWLHKPGLYDPYVCISMALISAVMGIKEHKYQFQTSSNEHTSLAKLMLWSYVVMIGLAIPGIRYFGMLGFLGLWFTTEMIQVLAILRLNERLFATVSKLDFSPVYKLFALMGLATAIGAWFAITAEQRPLPYVALIVVVFVGILMAVGYPIFGLAEVRTRLKGQARNLQKARLS